jgi:hypothetical protein
LFPCSFGAEDETAFDMLYCVAFEMMDAQWLAMRASYMEFNVSCTPSFSTVPSSPFFLVLHAKLFKRTSGLTLCSVIFNFGLATTTDVVWLTFIVVYEIYAGGIESNANTN